MSKTTLQSIVDFIHRRFTCWGTEMWENGNCYYFAQILKARFDYLQIFYDQIAGHFVAGTGKDFFDIHGIASVHKEALIKWKDIQKTDPAWARRLWTDCVR